MVPDTSNVARTSHVDFVLNRDDPYSRRTISSLLDEYRGVVFINPVPNRVRV